MAATIKDIAGRTGLGLATISKYLNGGNVLPENKVAIDAAIRELNYTVNEIARGLKTSRSKTVGIVIPEMDNTFFMCVITEIEDVLRKEGYAVIVCDCRTDGRIEAESVAFLLGKKVDGIINFPAVDSKRPLQPALQSGIPVVLVDRLVSGMGGKTDSVTIDNEAISREVAAFLLENGHREIGVITGPEGTYTADHRLDGFCGAAAERGVAMEPDSIARGEYTVEGGYNGFRQLMKQRPGLTAVFVTNHDMTLGALMAMREDGLNAPEDLSFVGFDSMDWAKIVIPSLTIVEQPMAQIGKEAAQLMLERLADGTGQKRDIVLPAKLNMGESVREISAL